MLQLMREIVVQQVLTHQVIMEEAIVLQLVMRGDRSTTSYYTSSCCGRDCSIANCCRRGCSTTSCYASSCCGRGWSITNCCGRDCRYDKLLCVADKHSRREERAHPVLAYLQHHTVAPLQMGATGIGGPGM